MVLLGTVTCKNLLYPLDYQDLVVMYADENDIDPCLIMAIIKTESNFIEDAHSGKASGLMQLTDTTGQWVAEKLNMNLDTLDLMDPEYNIRLGCYYIKYLIDHYEGDIDLALAAYNGGMGNVSRWLSNTRYSKDGKTLDHIPFSETREYVKKVRNQREIYRKMMYKDNDTYKESIN